MLLSFPTSSISSTLTISPEVGSMAISPRKEKQREEKVPVFPAPQPPALVHLGPHTAFLSVLASPCFRALAPGSSVKRGRRLSLRVFALGNPPCRSCDMLPLSLGPLVNKVFPTRMDTATAPIPHLCYPLASIPSTATWHICVFIHYLSPLRDLYLFAPYPL